MPPISEKTIGRLSLYRRLLNSAATEGIENIFSHEIAVRAGSTAAQVRRDLMTIGCPGSPTRGYDVAKLARSIEDFLDAPSGGQGTILVGVGNLGRALLAFFSYRRPRLSIVAAFDIDPAKADRVIQGCHCYRLDGIADFVKTHKIRVGIITVPASEAQKVADLLVWAGVRGILNFAPVALRVPETVYVDNIDMTMSLEKVAFFAGQGSVEREGE